MTPLRKKYQTHDDFQVISNLKKDNLSLDWYPLMWDYIQGIKHGVLSATYLNSQKNSPKLDFEQEYHCSFTSPYNSAIKYTDLTFKDKTSKNYSKSIDLLAAIGRDYGDPRPYYRK